MSPRNSPAFFLLVAHSNIRGLRCAAAGNESTSVGPFFLRNISFIRAISTSLTRAIVTPDSWKPSSFCRRCRKCSSGRRASRTARCWFRIIRAEFLFLVLSRTLLSEYPLCHSRCFPRAAGELHHTLHRHG